jgi:four helix bundle protein
MGYKVLQEKSYTFALLIISVANLLAKNHEYVLSKQLLRSGTSIGANIEEAIGAYTSKEYPAKIAIAYKEARETKYWLNLLSDTGQISTESSVELLEKNEELLKILGTIKLKYEQNPVK